jgi:hypothetical protein
MKNPLKRCKTIRNWVRLAKLCLAQEESPMRASRLMEVPEDPLTFCELTTQDDNGFLHLVQNSANQKID